MRVQISQELNKIFIKSQKNPNYALKFLLSSIDLDTCLEGVKLVEEFKLYGETIDVEIDDDNMKNIKRIFDKTDSLLIEQLLWVSLLFPEV